MVRNNRHLIRLSLVLMLLAMGVIGYALLYLWQATGISFAPTIDSAQNGDWIDIFAALGEAAIQLFLGLASPQ